MNNERFFATFIFMPNVKQCKNTYDISSSSSSNPSLVGISNISTLSLNNTRGVLLPEDGADNDGSEVGVWGAVVNNTILSVDTEGVSVIDNMSAGFSLVGSLRRVKLSIYTGLSSRPSSSLFNIKIGMY